MEQIELRNFPMDLKFFVEEFDYVYRVQVWFSALDRNKGDPIELHVYFSYPKDNYSKAEAIRAALIEAATHEIDECLYVDDQRIFDPHSKERKMREERHLAYLESVQEDLSRAANEGMIYHERE